VARVVVALPPLAEPGPSSAPGDVALLATGGSGGLASVVGIARAFEDRGMRPALISLCSGSALFGFPIAAGFSASEVAEFVLALRPADYVDVDWRRLMRLAPTLGRGFAGIVRGARLDATYREFLGDITLGELPIPAYAPIWNVDENRLDYLGPRTHPDVSVARAVRMAVALPLFIAPVALDGLSWCDCGIVDIFPVRPALDIEPRACAAVAVNGFYPPDFTGENVHGWERQPASIVTVAGQVRTCQQVELARVNLQRLRAAMPVAMIEPVLYKKVRGLGFYRQFLSTRDWADFMTDGHRAGSDALATLTADARLVHAARSAE
jgi:NTE family protein